MKRALIVVDYQYDFADPSGQLYVPDGEKIKQYINDLVEESKNQGALIVASKDWHPENHYSFKIWNKHCVHDTPGAELYFDDKKIDKIILKGENPEIESYSAFYDEKGNSNGLDEYLKQNKITDVTIVGLALEYCVKKTYEDAIKCGYNTIIDYQGVKALQE